MVSGAARVVLPAHQAWRLSDQLVDALEALTEHPDPDSGPLPTTDPEDA